MIIEACWSHNSQKAWVIQFNFTATIFDDEFKEMCQTPKLNQFIIQVATTLYPEKKEKELPIK